jgi:predicted alpha/beta hydrolase family esterase
MPQQQSTAAPAARAPARAAVPLIVPGWQDSGPEHWQSHWQARLHAERVQQTDWDRPLRTDWVRGLQRAIAQADRPVLLIAHSLGCITIAHWALTAPGAFQARRMVRGALLVAPADVERAEAPGELRDFAPVPDRRLPFPSIVVASTTDPYCQFERAQLFAARWGARLVSLGAAGHINPDAGYTEWADGLALLQPLQAGVR